MSAAILFHLGLAAYTAAAVAYLTWLVKPGPTAARAGRVALAVGFALHGAAVLLRVTQLPDVAAFRFGEGLSFLAFVTVGAYLLLDKLYGLPVIGSFVAPLVIAVLVPAHLVGSQEVELAPIRGFVLPVHIGVALGGVGLFALGFGVALMYLLLEREVKAKRLGTMFRRLPSLDLLDRLNYRLIVLGFVLLSATVATGALFAKQSDAAIFELGAKQSFSLVAWGLCATVVLLRHLVGWRGRRVAIATMAGFALMVFAYAGVFARGGAA